MELFIAGGVGEHGRNCFFVQSDTLTFLVDCGVMTDTTKYPYPHLTPDKIRQLDAVFLTHSHVDHAGALPWLYDNGFHGMLIASNETLHQLGLRTPAIEALEDMGTDRMGHFHKISIQWGRSGHCEGSVWYYFSENGRSVLFSGDYTENTLVYSCDRIRNQHADIAVLDCAYGLDRTTYSDACKNLIYSTKEMLSAYSLILFPVPKYGRGLEILKLLSENIDNIEYYADDLFLENLAKQQAGGFWFQQDKINVSVQSYNSQQRGIVFISDPQLRSHSSQCIAEHVLSVGGMTVMTGTFEKNSFSQKLFMHGKMRNLRYPVHLNYSQYKQLTKENCFSQVIPYHCAENIN